MSEKHYPYIGGSFDRIVFDGDSSVWVPESENAIEQVRRLQDENKRLRESVRNLLTCIKHEECEESCPHYGPAYSTYGHDSHGSIVVEDEYLGCCLAGLENCNSAFFDTDEYLRELGTGEEQ